MRSILVLIAVVGLCGCVSDAHASNSRVTLSIAVHTTKTTGQAWDPMGGAPEIAIKIGDPAGSFMRWHASAHVAQPTLLTALICRDSFTCRHTDVVIPPGPTFRVDVWDQDTGPDPANVGTAICKKPTPYLEVTCTVGTQGRLRSIKAKGQF